MSPSGILKNAMNSTTHKTGGLADVIAGQTAISTVGKDGVGLTYRGYSIEDLAHQSTFEEVAYLLIYGHLPNPSELESYQNQLGSLRGRVRGGLGSGDRRSVLRDRS